MDKRLIPGPKDWDYGYTAVTKFEDKEPNTMMDFGILRQKAGDVFTDEQHMERAYLLVYGKAKVEFDGQCFEIARENCFDYEPWVLSVPNDVRVTITAEAESEWTVHRTNNEKTFPCKLYTPEECASEHRGQGTMREASTRIVRTVFDYSNAPWSNLVVGEVIGFPGKWSSYPPHHHPQPEIYYYKTNPENGFGYGELGDEVVKVQNNDTVFIAPGLTHPHCTAPGYALWYLWAIRHLDGKPYKQPECPVFLKEHLWVMEKDSVYFGDKK